MLPYPPVIQNPVVQHRYTTSFRAGRIHRHMDTTGSNIQSAVNFKPSVEYLLPLIYAVEERAVPVGRPGIGEVAGKSTE